VDKTLFGIKKKLFALCLLPILLLLGSSPVHGAVKGFVAKCDEGCYFQYEYNQLLNSYVLYIMGKQNGLYEDFVLKKPVAFLDSVNGYIDYNDVIDRYAVTLIEKKRFSLNGYTESAEAKKAKMPASLEMVTLSNNELVFSTTKLDLAKPATTAKPSSSNPPVIPAVELTVTPLLSTPRVTLSQAQQWAASRRAHPRFIDIAPLYWDYGGRTGLCPEVLYAQAAYETNFGRYTGQVPHFFNNWAGIKVAVSGGDRPEDHQVFATPEDGVRAHFNHMAAYVGINPIGTPHDRYHVIKRLPWAGTIETLEQTSGRWAPSLTYHVRIVAMIEEMNK
jgi:hypothetical protein